MDIWQAIILGIVQGITEWLPISSSGHLVIFEHILGVSQPVIFNILLHLGSLVVILFVFWKQIKKLVLGIFKKDKEQQHLFLKLVVASIPIALVGFFLGNFIKSIFNDLATVGYSLFFTSIILFLSKYPKKKIKKLTYGRAILMGVGQAFAILPGVSRSGTTISAGMMVGIKKENVAFFAFLMFIPAIIGATIMEIGSIETITNVWPLIIGMLFTIIFGFLSLKLLLKIIQHNKFYYFSVYCLVLGLGLILL